MTNFTLKGVLRVASSIFTLKNLLRTASGMFLLALFSFVMLLQYHSAKTSHQKQIASALPSLEEMESQAVSYIEGDEVVDKDLKLQENSEALNQEEQALIVNYPDKEPGVMKKEPVFMNMDTKKYMKGEKMAMNTVSFHPGSNVLLKKSEPELKKLLEMLMQNPKLKVKILGYTDKNLSGKIYKAREENIASLFNTDNCRITSGNSRKLSVLRVRIIESYLVKNGISGKRIITRGWGGKKKLQKKNDLKVDDHFLVEVEMLN